MVHSGSYSNGTETNSTLWGYCSTVGSRRPLRADRVDRKEKILEEGQV